MNKRKLFFGLAGAFASAIAITTTAVVATSCGSSSGTKGEWYKNVADPYKELNMLATTMDAAGYTPGDGSKYIDKAKIVNDKVRGYVKAVAGVMKQQSLNNKSIVFLKNDSMGFDPNANESAKLANINTFHMEQPILYPTVYSQPDNAEVPGMGMSFPAPVKDEGLRMFDDWFEIGASALNSGNSSVPATIADSWKGTADYVIFLYDSKNMSAAQEQAFIKYALNNNSPNFLAKQILNPKSACKQVIPLDIEYFYNTTFHVLGNQEIAEWLSSVLIDAADGTFEAITKQPAIAALDAQKQTIAPANVMTKDKLTNRKQGIKDNLVNMISARDNTNGHFAALGLQPDLFVENGNQNSQQYQKVGAFFVDTDPTGATGTQIYNPSTISVKTKDFLTHSEPTQIEAANIYAAASDRSNFGNQAPWPLTTSQQSKQQTVSEPELGIQTRDAGKFTLEQLIAKKYIGTCVYTERNDTDYTQSAYVLNITLPDSKIVNLQSYYDSKKDYFNLMN